MPDPDDLGLSYLEALHGVQSGVVAEIAGNPQTIDPKHLRMGINSAHVSDAALVRLLVDRGLITYEELHEELRLEANRELVRYETSLSELMGRKVTLR